MAQPGPTCRPDITKIGSWGGPGAYSFGFGEFVSYIKEVSLYTGNVFNGMEITYVDDKGLPKIYKIGKSVGELQTFTLRADEYINRVDGFYKGYEGEICISGLKFYTNLGSYGSYGPEGGQNFTVQITDGKIIGFFGECNCHINSIGFCFDGSNSVNVTLN